MRRLAIAAGGFSAAVFLANYIIPLRLLPLLALLCAAAALGLAFVRKNRLKRLVIGFAALAVGFLYFGGAYLICAAPAKELDGVDAELEATVLTYPVDYGEYSRYELRISLPEGGSSRAVVYDRSGAETEKMAPGWHLRLSANCRAADTRYGKDYDYYNSNGIFLVLSVKEPPEILSARCSLLLSFGQDISRAVCGVIERIFPQDAAPFMKSLLIGSRTELYGDYGTYMAMGRAGITHIVAISGMHVAFLISLVQLILGLSRRSSVCCIAAVWVFVLASGASPSALRAGVMQSLLLIAPLFGRENDAPTSLLAALALLLCVNPYAAASVSLQLSFGAVAGLMLFSRGISDCFTSWLPNNIIGRVLRWPLEIAASSLAVMVFTVPLSALHFGYVAILSPLANILCLWAVSLCFCLGYAACFIGLIFAPFGRLLAWGVSFLARYIIRTACFVSDFSFAALYINDWLNLLWLVLIYLLFIIAALSRLPRWAKLSMPAALSVISLVLLLRANAIGAVRGAGTITVLDVGQGQCISIISGDSTVLIDCGGIYSLDNAGETAGSYLLTHRRTKIDTLLVTHLHADHANGIARLMELVDVGEIIIPDGVPDDDDMLSEIASAAEKHSVTLRRITQDECLSVGNIALALYAPPADGGTNERCMIIRATIGEYDMLVTGDSPKSMELCFAEENDIDGTELLIVGHHGSKYSSCYEFLSAIDADTAIISVGYNNYGHPTNETLERLAACGYNIYRTDLNGNVEIRLPAG